MTPEKYYGIVDDGQTRDIYEGGAKREPARGKGRYDLIPIFATRRIAQRLELGTEKYSVRNWEKGISYSRCIDAAKRHIDQYIMGMRDEDHLAAAACNLMFLMDYEDRNMDKYDDLPHYLDGKRKENDK